EPLRGRTQLDGRALAGPPVAVAHGHVPGVRQDVGPRHRRSRRVLAPGTGTAGPRPRREPGGPAGRRTRLGGGRLRRRVRAARVDRVAPVRPRLLQLRDRARRRARAAVALRRGGPHARRRVLGADPVPVLPDRTALGGAGHAVHPAGRTAAPGAPLAAGAHQAGEPRRRAGRRAVGGADGPYPDAALLPGLHAAGRTGRRDDQVADRGADVRYGVNRQPEYAYVRTTTSTGSDRLPAASYA